jgi:hypothetical protein
VSMDAAATELLVFRAADICFLLASA